MIGYYAFLRHAKYEQWSFSSPSVEDHFSFKTIVRGGLFKKVPLYTIGYYAFLWHAKYERWSFSSPLVEDHLSFKTIVRGALFKGVSLFMVGC